MDISDPLFSRARELARKRNSTLRALIEQGLRKVIAEEREGRIRKKADFATYGAGGLTDELKDASWEEIRALIYPERGDNYS